MEESQRAKNFTAVSRLRKDKTSSDEILKIISEEYDNLSRRIERSKVQEAAGVRSHLRARKLAEALIGEKGEIDLEKLELAIKYLKEHRHFPQLERMEDSLSQKHMLSALEHLAKCRQTQKLVQQFTKPIGHKGAEEVIRQTLDLPRGMLITDKHVRQAVLSSWFSYLRQSVGSCFATAPAMLVQSQMPDQFLIDLKEMLETGRLKRVSNGQEYHAPISASSGVGDLKRPLVLESNAIKDFREVGTSPGIMAALIAAGVIDKNKSLKETVDETRVLTIDALKVLQKDSHYFAVTPEKIIRQILFQTLGLEEEKYEEWLNRPSLMVFGDLARNMPHASVGQKGVGSLAASFKEKMDEARIAFIGLGENALLKTWEFTVASFAETKADFSKWNLYASLGFHSEEPGGLGECLYNEINERLDRSNRKVQEYQSEYEMLYSQVKYCEARVRSATSEKELVWLRAEAQSKYNEFQTFEIMRNKEHYLAERLATLFGDMVNFYLSLFPRYFQEVYDAEVHDTTEGLWDDRPAGFRLLFKHGRMNTSQWSRIDNSAQFSDALSSFFSLTESEISHAPHLESVESLISELVTKMIQHVKTKEFLESSLWRMSKRYSEPLIKDPLDHLDKITKKPWAYTSGGNLENLVSSYFKLREKPKEVERFVENEMELLVFLADSIKLLNNKITAPFSENSDRRMLMFSPTHAFNLMPGLKNFYTIWQNNSYTYTWVRDELVYPMQRYWEGYEMNEARYEKLIDLIKPLIGHNYLPRFNQLFNQFPGTMSPSDLSNYIIDLIETDYGLQHLKRLFSKEMLDSLLLKSLPLLTKDQSIELASNLSLKLEGFKAQWLEAFQPLDSTIDVIEAVLSIYMVKRKETSFEHDYMNILVQEARNLGWLPPAPVIFADTNWPKFFFTFMVNPGSGRLELWRTDRLGLTGSPMSEWKVWLNGSRKDPKWGILTHTSEYQF